MGQDVSTEIDTESHISYDEGLDALANSTKFDETKVDKIFTELAGGKNSELNRRTFEKAAEQFGLLNNVEGICRTPVRNGKGQLVTLHLNEEAVRKSVLDTLWSIFDSDRSGAIDFEEFVIGLSVVLNGTLEQKAKALFRMYDKNGDGSLTRKELVRSLKHAMRAGKKIMALSEASLKKDLGKKGANQARRSAKEMAKLENLKEMVDDIFKTADLDNSNTISYSEFIVYVKKDPSIMMTLFRVTGDSIISHV